MRTNVGRASVLILAAAVSAFGQAKPARGKKADPDMVTGPLLRMSLLETKEGPFLGAKRDPFIPGLAVSPQEELLRPRTQPFAVPAAPLAPGVKPGAEGAAEAEAPPSPPVNVRYVGFIQGKEKFLAIILFNGQAMAVAAGETLGNVWKVEKVGPAEIEILGPDGPAIKFALEGERK